MATKAVQIDWLVAGVLDSSGNQLSGGSVEFYESGTTTAKNCWSNADKTVAITTASLDATGRNDSVFADGTYRIKVKNSAGTVVYDFDPLKYASAASVVIAVAADYTVRVDDDVVVVDTDSAGANVTLNLPAVATATRIFVVINTGATYNVVLDPNGTEQIDGATTFAVTPTKKSSIVAPATSSWAVSSPSAIDADTLDGHASSATAVAGKIPIYNVSGQLVGPMLGDVTGNVTGNVTGDVTGAVTGNVTGNLTGNVTGNLTGNVTGNLTGLMTGGKWYFGRVTTGATPSATLPTGWSAASGSGTGAAAITHGLNDSGLFLVATSNAASGTIFARIWNSSTTVAGILSYDAAGAATDSIVTFLVIDGTPA